MRVMVTGGAGYIGSVVTEALVAHGHDVVVIDNLARGHRDAVDPDADFVELDVMDRECLEEALIDFGIEGVIHLAAESVVGESVADPAKYYRTNLVGGLSLLDAMQVAGVSRLVFSSSAAVYGDPERLPIDEAAPTRPTSPYGETKLTFERALAWYRQAYGLRSVSLRYFNAAGATERCGERHEPETHLIPLLLRVALGELPEVVVCGVDYPTKDGTCLRDFIHVQDLAEAHLLALHALAAGGQPSSIYNVGCGGEGYTVREVIEVAREVTGAPIPVRVGPRRPGDPAALVASSVLIQRELEWRPAHQDLREIVGSAWRWMLARRSIGRAA